MWRTRQKDRRTGEQGAILPRVHLAVTPDSADDREEFLSSQTGEGDTQEILVHLVKKVQAQGDV